MRAERFVARGDRTLASRVRGPASALRAALLAAAALWASPSAALQNPSHLNVGVAIHGIAGVSDLTATPGSLSGTINLVWTEPRRAGTSAPYSYDIRVSTTGQIPDHAAFLAAKPLSDFSPTAPPLPG